MSESPRHLRREPKDNIVQGLASLVIPGAGQFWQSRPRMGLSMLLFAIVLWFLWLGFLIHLWSGLDAWLYRGDLGTAADLTD